MSSPSQKKCSICSTPTSQRCNQCTSSYYCSGKCQKTDWPLHNLLCGQFKAFGTPPNKSVRRGIFFPAKEVGARFVWVTCVSRPASGGIPAHEQVSVKGYLSSDTPDRIVFRTNPLRSRDLENTIEIFNDPAPKDKSAKSQSTAKAQNGLPSYRGPMLALKKNGLGPDTNHYDNMDTNDFSDVVDYLCYHSNINLGDMDRGDWDTKVKAKETISGVRINCRGDHVVFKRAKFEPVQVPSDHLVFQAPVAKISKLIGLPIRVRRLLPDEAAKNDKRYNETNQAATFLHLHPNPDDGGDGIFGWGWAPMEWQKAAGSVVVVREDGKKLLPHHLEAICYYCQYVLQPLFEDSMGTGMHPESPMSKADVVSRITPREFENFYLGFTNYKRDNDPNWKHVEHPYPITETS